MSSIKKILAISILSILSTHAFSQDYGSVNYMKKKIYITPKFFEMLNKEYNLATRHNSTDIEIYHSLVDLLSKKGSIIHVDEAKRIRWTRVSVNDFPYSEEQVSKRVTKEVSYMIYYILLPVIEDYMKDHESHEE